LTPFFAELLQSTRPQPTDVVLVQTNCVKWPVASENLPLPKA
jgi:hypothetical protein